MIYPLVPERSTRADYCEAMYLQAAQRHKADMSVYWARQEHAALYPDGRENGRVYRPGPTKQRKGAHSYAHSQV